MTDTLGDIRARDAALIEENGYLFPPGEDYDSEPWRDRRALLAEVDALNLTVIGLKEMMGADQRSWAAERRRMHEMTMAIPVNYDITWADDDPIQAFVLRSAVLALLEEDHG